MKRTCGKWGRDMKRWQREIFRQNTGKEENRKRLDGIEVQYRQDYGE